MVVSGSGTSGAAGPWYKSPLQAYDRGYATGLNAGRVEALRAFWETSTRVNDLGSFTRPGSDTVWVKRADVLSVLAEESARTEVR